MTITSFSADHTLDLSGYGEPTPQFGLRFTASCQQPLDIAAVWTITTGGDPNEETVATCVQGSFGSIPQALQVKGCGSHTLTALPRDAVGNRALSEPLRVAFKVC